MQAHLDMIGYEWMIWGKSFKPTPNFLAPKTFTPNRKQKGHQGLAAKTNKNNPNHAL